MTHYIPPIGCFSLILVVLGYILLNTFFVTTSDEEINKLILKKKETWIQNKLHPIFSDKRDESYNNLVLRLGRADSTDYRATIAAVGPFIKDAKNICNKNYSITVRIKEWGNEIKKNVCAPKRHICSFDRKFSRFYFSRLLQKFFCVPFGCTY